MAQYREDNASREDLRTLVLICTKLERLGNGLDLDEIHRWLQLMVPSVDVRTVPQLCERPGRAVETVATNGAVRVVLGLCSQDYSEIELHSHVRMIGLDPFGVEVVNLGAHCALVHPRSQATEKAKLLLEAAVARARAFFGGDGESVKPVFSLNQTVSRRALFTLPPLHYEPVVSIRRVDCAFDEGCRVCATTCPHEALEPSEDTLIGLDKSRCTACGACVSACPQIAIDLPGASSDQIGTQVAALLENESIDVDARAILFVCKRGVSTLSRLAENGFSYPAGWLPVEVPCVGIITPAWLLQCLSQGAAAVGVLPCGLEDCRFGHTEITKGKMAYCREFLGLIGANPDAIRLLDPCDEAELARTLSYLPRQERKPRGDGFGDVSLFGLRATARSLLGLAEQFASPVDSSLAHPFSPLGVVTLETGCTICEACTRACPTEALGVQRDSEGVALNFDPGLCIGCEACVPVCPERVVRVGKVTDLSRLAQERVTLHRGSEVLCEKCGGPVAPDDMIKKITALLGSNPTVSTITRFCLSCRGVTLSGQEYGEKNLE
ncbi:MAG: 4Fe-4S binding protein [Candidatus Binatia bacterium]